MYVCAGNQCIFNSYLKEEIFCTLKRVPRVRVILDEMPFTDENDELLKYLMETKRQNKIELILISQNINEMMHGREGLDFSNIVMFIHGTPAATDDISGALFGSYQHYFPVPVAGNTPHVIFSIKRSVQWQIQSEEDFVSEVRIYMQRRPFWDIHLIIWLLRQQRMRMSILFMYRIFCLH